MLSSSAAPPAPSAEARRVAVRRAVEELLGARPCARPEDGEARRAQLHAAWLLRGRGTCYSLPVSKPLVVAPTACVRHITPRLHVESRRRAQAVSDALHAGCDRLLDWVYPDDLDLVLLPPPPGTGIGGGTRALPAAAAAAAASSSSRAFTHLPSPTNAASMSSASPFAGPPPPPTLLCVNCPWALAQKSAFQFYLPPAHAPCLPPSSQFPRTAALRSCTRAPTSRPCPTPSPRRSS
jgi:hypothetical protein